ncbi:glycosyltransferase family 2 protein [Mongoliibacter ruber]|uniref:Glycosyl transferase family 2 n=1 Tax=Mongoliibacter ruber TaxID=1750599 RepID=A0A2T0WNW9_9BACT|nr:glycosyltransferase family 2 protein [Mongoliibacter ruber]PRY88397.1 glycosyl transferase family 2 [Mongoliibacter ruber]
MKNTEYPLVSVLFITYKRFDKLKETYDNFVKNCTYPNLELIVADDGSPSKIQDKIKTIHFDKYCLSPQNKGLGFNQNQGVEAASGDYILNLQDDWNLLHPSDFLQKAVSLLQAEPKIGLIRFWGGQPNIQQFRKQAFSLDSLDYMLFEGDKSLKSEEASSYVYSDRPHLKRKIIHEEIGMYTTEKLPVLKVELEFCKRFEASRFDAAVISGYEDLFDHTGLEDSFNVEQQKENFRNKINQTPILGWMWRAYVKFRYGHQEYQKWIRK